MKTWMQRLLTAILLATGWPATAADSTARPANFTKEAEGEFDYFENNWNVVGLKDYERGARVTPDNRVMLDEKHGAVQVCFGRDLAPLSRKQGKLAMDGWMPVMLIAADDGPVRYEFTFWATPLPGVKDWRKAFDWPTEGENFLVWVR